jgi:hypothetical protein
MRLKPFECLILIHPKRAKKDEEEEGRTRELDQALLLAADQNQALLLAARRIPEEHLADLDRVEVLIRPF